MVLVEKLLRDEERHEAEVLVAGRRLRITLVDCDLLGITEGMPLSEEDLIRLTEAESRLACVQKAFSFLSYGDLSRKRLTEKLRRTFPKELCEETVSLLESRGYLNDWELAKRYAETYFELRAYGPMRVKQELYAKGFLPEVIEEAMQPYADQDHRETVRELLERRYSMDALADPAVRRKAADWLRRQGYSWSVVSDVFHELF